MLRRNRWIAVMLLAGVLPAWAEEIEIPVPRPEKLVGLSLGGSNSCYVINGHYTTGWARYVQTVPATRLLGGVGSWGVTPKNEANCDDFFRRCAQIGLRHVRWEVGWGSGQYRADMSKPYRLQPNAEKVLLASFRASKRHGVKILVLINAHQGMPCPVAGTGAAFAAPAAKGDTAVVLNVDRPGVLKEGYSGISGLTYYCAAEGLFKKFAKADEKAHGRNAFAVTLSKPLPWDAPKGKRITVHTLQYRPFGDPKTDARTYQGWADHAGRLAQLAKEAGLEDGDVDFELWNELTFGTGFLSISRYDKTLKGAADQRKMLALGAAAIRKIFPEKAQVINGFSNTTFFFGGQFIGKYPPGISGESYHPYGFGVYHWPDHAKKRGVFMHDGRNVDGFVPTYTTCFPEQHGNYLLSHSLICLMQPEMRQQLRKRDGMAADQFMTECGLSIQENPELRGGKAVEGALRSPGAGYAAFCKAEGLKPGEAASLHEWLRARYLARLYPFYLNKGLSAIDDGTVVAFHPQKAMSTFLHDGEAKSLLAWHNVQRLAKMLEPLTRSLEDKQLVPLQFRLWTDEGNDRAVFGAKGTWVFDKKAKAKTLYFRDVVCLLPFQLNADDFAVAAYVQTRNIAEDHLDCGRYTIELTTLKADTYRVGVWDPLLGRTHPFEKAGGGSSGAIKLRMALPDYPVWIVGTKGREYSPAAAWGKLK